MSLKRYLVLAAVLASSFATHEASAISLRFKFNVYSSGPNIYACNAGIRAPEKYDQVCYIEGTTTACNPNDCGVGTTCYTRCECSGNDGGDWLMNFMNVTAQDWSDNGAAAGGNIQHIALQSPTWGGAWAEALDDTTAWTKTISNLSFNLSSELYGAQYFVDVCYRGPQIEFWEDGVQGNFSSIVQASATDFFQTGGTPSDDDNSGLVIPGTVDGKKYTQLAGLTVQSFIVCDQQGLGTYKYARDNNNNYNTTNTSAGFQIGSNGVPSGATEGADFFAASSVSPISSQAIDLFGGTNGTFWLNLFNSYVPRFCKVRYVFSETNAYASSGVNLRKWQRHGAQVCTYTDIEESVSH